jgi:hypothetical protein
MGHAAFVVAAVFAATALRCIEWLIDGTNDVGDRHFTGWARQTVAATGAAHAFDEAVAAQLAEQLLQIGKGNFLTIADSGQRHRPFGCSAVPGRSSQ